MPTPFRRRFAPVYRARRFLRTILVAAAVCMLWACSDDPAEVSARALAAARDFSAAGETVQAANQYKQALLAVPENADARFELAGLLLEIGDGNAALKELDKAAEYGFDPAQLTVPRMRALLLLERHEEIIEEIVAEAIDSSQDPAAAHADKPADFFSLRGHAFLADGNFDNALYWYGRARELEAGNREALLGEAAVAVARGEHDDAAVLLKTLTEQHADFAPGWELAGEYHRQAGDLEAAIGAYTKAISNRLYDWPDRLRRAFIYLAAGRLEEAEQDLKSVKALRVEHPSIQHGLGIIKAQRGNIDGAIADFEQSIALAPDYLQAQFHLGALLLEKGEFEQANYYLTRYARAFPEYPEAVRSAAITKMRMNDDTGARDLLSKYLLNHPDDVSAQTLMAMVHSDDPDDETRVEMLAAIASEQSNSLLARLNLGVGLLKIGKPDEAVTALREVIKAEENTEDTASVILVRTLIAARRYEDALEEAQRLVDKHPGKGWPLVIKAVAQLGLDDRAGYAETLREALRLDPGNSYAANALARDAVNASDHQAAARYYQALLDQRPGHLGALLGLTEAALAEEDTGQAISFLQRAVAAHPTELSPRTFLARLLITNGAAKEALELLSEVEPLFAQQPDFLELLGKAYADTGQTERALAVYDDLARLPPPTSRKYYLLAQAHALGKDLDGMRRNLELAVAQSENFLAGKLALFRLELTENKLDAAADRFAVLEQQLTGVLILEDLRGDLAVARGNVSDAVAAYRTVHEFSPGPGSAGKLARALTLAGKNDDALKLLQEAWAEMPGDPGLGTELANLHLARGEDQAASAIYEALIEGGNASPLILNNLAWSLRNADPARGQQYAERALKASPGWPAALDTMAELARSRGDLGGAVSYLRKAVANSSGINQATFQLRLAEILLEAGRPDEARSILEGLNTSDQTKDVRAAATARLERLNKG